MVRALKGFMWVKCGHGSVEGVLRFNPMWLIGSLDHGSDLGMCVKLGGSSFWVGVSRHKWHGANLELVVHGLRALSRDGLGHGRVEEG